MNFRLSAPDTHRIRVYRAAATSITSSGNAVAFDTQSTLASGLGYSHTSGVLTVLAPGYHRFKGQIEVGPTVLLNAVMLTLEADTSGTGSGYASIGRRIWPATGAALVASDTLTPSVEAGMDLPEGTLVRLMAQTSGAASAALVTGESVSFLEAWRYP